MKDIQANKAVKFLKGIFAKTKIQKAVIAVSGGIDSAVSLTLTTNALGAENVYPILLPYDKQSVKNSELICEWNKIPRANWNIVNIKKSVDLLCETLQIKKEDKVRRGNIMARVRMICVYDLAKKLNALVVGTENKSEKYLGYFTRFGDEASDIEPLQHLYKSQVRELAINLNLPSVFLETAPSAELWDGQTDEDELGFSYEEADQVIAEFLKEKKKDSEISESVRKKILARIKSSAFKHEVPYAI